MNRRQLIEVHKYMFAHRFDVDTSVELAKKTAKELNMEHELNKKSLLIWKIAYYYKTWI